MTPDPLPPTAAAPSSRLRLRDVRRAFRLIGEVREMGDDPKIWRPHLVTELRKLTRAEIVVSSEIHFRTTRAPGVMHMVDLGWGTDADGNAWEIRTERDDEQPETYKLAIAPPKRRRRRRPPPPTDAQAAADGEGELVPVRPALPIYGGSCFVLSQVALPHIAAVDRIGVHRVFGDDTFTAAEHRLIRLFHVELGRLWRHDVLARASDPRTDLPPRMKQTLDELLAGGSEKQIASKLKISPHTVHNYVKALHQRFEVSSRGELLAKLGRPRPGFTPRFSVGPPGAGE